MHKSRTTGLRAVSTLGLLVLSGTVCLNAQAPATPTYQKNAPAVPVKHGEAGSRVTLRYNKIEGDADTLVKKAVQAYQTGSFEEAIEYYIAAKKQLEKVAPRSKEISEKIQSCEIAISRCYFNWAEKLYYQALETAELKKYDEAIAICEKAIEIWPAGKKKLQATIEKIKRMKNSAAYVQATDEDTLLPDLKDRAYNLDVLMRQGDALFADGQWAAARAKYEEILATDPYNTAAIEAVRKTNIKLIAAGKRRRNGARQQYASEAIWTPVIPLIPRESHTAGETVQPEEQGAIVKEQRARTINDKLDSIIIPSLDFEQELVSEVLKKLQLRSQELTNGDGVNIVYLGSGQNLGAPAAAAPAGGGPGEGGDVPAATVEGGEDEEPMITILTQNVPLRDAIQSICNAAKLKYKIEEHAVVIAPRNVPLDERETRIFPIEKTTYDDISSEGDLKAYFKKQGIDFPENTGVKYISGRLVVTHTPANIERIKKHLDDINQAEPQVLIETKFMEVAMNDIEELGFQYQVSRQNGNFKYIQEPDGAYRTGSGENVSIYTTGNQTGNFYYSNPVNGYYQYMGSVAPGMNLPAQGNTTYYYTKAPIQHGSSQLTFGPNSANLVRNVNDIGNRTVMDGLFSAQYTDYRSGFSVSGAVRAIDQSDSADVLFCPRITTTNNYPATIKMVTKKYFPTDWEEAEIGTISSGGREVPLFTSSIPELEEDEIGVRLDVQPTIGENGRTITLPMKPSVKEHVGWVDYSYPLTVSVEENVSETFTNIIRMPIFEDRVVRTLVSCDDGETVILGGVVHDNSNSVDDQYPLLGDIPLIGRLFQSKAKVSEKKNLLIFMTCRLINPDGSPVREREMRGLPPFRQ